MSINDASPADWDEANIVGAKRLCEGSYHLGMYDYIEDNAKSTPSNISIKRSTLGTDAKARKGVPLFKGCIDYFPRALAAVAECSLIGATQHGQTQEDMHWNRAKSGSELDALMRHLVDAGYHDSDGIRHSAKVAWRALANLELELERDEDS
jgi:hypothetical protein